MQRRCSLPSRHRMDRRVSVESRPRCSRCIFVVSILRDGFRPRNVLSLVSILAVGFWIYLAQCYSLLTVHLGGYFQKYIIPGERLIANNIEVGVQKASLAVVSQWHQVRIYYLTPCSFNHRLGGRCIPFRGQGESRIQIRFTLSNQAQLQ